MSQDSVKQVIVFWHENSKACNTLIEPIQNLEFDGVAFINVKDIRVRNYVMEKYNIRNVPSIIIMYDSGKQQRLTGLYECQSFFQPVIDEWHSQQEISAPTEPETNPFISVDHLPPIPENTPSSDEIRQPSQSLPASAVSKLSQPPKAKPVVTDKGNSDKPPSISLPAGALKGLRLA